MAKVLDSKVKLQLPAGKATAGPPVGSTLGPKGINLGQFVKEFNEKTSAQARLTIPCVISIYKHRSFDFILKTPPAAILIMKELGIETASAKPNKQIVGTLTKAQVRKIAETKMPDLNAASIEAAESMIRGTARSMGVKVED